MQTIHLRIWFGKEQKRRKRVWKICYFLVLWKVVNFDKSSLFQNINEIFQTNYIFDLNGVNGVCIPCLALCAMICAFHDFDSLMISHVQSQRCSHTGCYQQTIKLNYCSNCLVSMDMETIRAMVYCKWVHTME